MNSTPPQQRGTSLSCAEFLHRWLCSPQATGSGISLKQAGMNDSWTIAGHRRTRCSILTGIDEGKPLQQPGYWEMTRNGLLKMKFGGGSRRL